MPLQEDMWFSVITYYSLTGNRFVTVQTKANLFERQEYLSSESVLDTFVCSEAANQGQSVFEG